MASHSQVATLPLQTSTPSPNALSSPGCAASLGAQLLRA
jgi:hypothetical protein